MREEMMPGMVAWAEVRSVGVFERWSFCWKEGKLMDSVWRIRG